MDVAVCGSGIIGSSIAWELARQGCRVTIYDAGTFAGESSWAGAGMLAPGGEFLAQSRWAELAVESLRLYPAFVDELSRESGIAIDYHACGAIDYAFTDEERANLIARAERQHPLGIRTQPVPEGMFYPDDAAIDPRHVTEALRVLLERLGATFILQNRVTDARKLPHDAVVVAAGAWSSSLIPTIDAAQSIPIKGHLVSWQLPPSTTRGPILRHGHTYILQRATGLVIAGSNEEQVGFDRTINQQACDEIAAKARRIMPALANAATNDRWNGFRPATPTLLPEVRHVQDTNVWLSYGHYRNGILFAPLNARMVAGEIIASAGNS